MSAIVQARFSSGTYFSQESVGGPPTNLHSCHRRSFLPAIATLHERDHLPFCDTLRFLFHRPLLVFSVRSRIVFSTTLPLFSQEGLRALTSDAAAQGPPYQKRQPSA